MCRVLKKVGEQHRGHELDDKGPLPDGCLDPSQAKTGEPLFGRVLDDHRSVLHQKMANSEVDEVGPPFLVQLCLGPTFR